MELPTRRGFVILELNGAVDFRSFYFGSGATSSPSAGPFASEAGLAPDGEVIAGEPQLSIGNYFGLPAQWPGPDRPFRD
jgi:hypothetical protein